MGDLVHLRFAAYGKSEVGEVRVSLLMPQPAEEQDEYVLPLTAVFGIQTAWSFGPSPCSSTILRPQNSR